MENFYFGVRYGAMGDQVSQSLRFSPPCKSLVEKKHTPKWVQLWKPATTLHINIWLNPSACVPPLSQGSQKCIQMRFEYSFKFWGPYSAVSCSARARSPAPGTGRVRCLVRPRGSGCDLEKRPSSSVVSSATIARGWADRPMPAQLSTN